MQLKLNLPRSGYIQKQNRRARKMHEFIKTKPNSICETRKVSIEANSNIGIIIVG